MSTSVDLMALVNAVGLRLADGWIVMKHRRQLENASPASSGSRQEQTEASASLTSKRDAPWKSAMRSLEKKKSLLVINALLVSVALPHGRMLHIARIHDDRLTNVSERVHGLQTV